MTYSLPKKDRTDLHKLLGQTGKGGRFLDEMEYWIEIELARQSFGNLSRAQQKSRFIEIADAANKLARVLGNLDGDTDALLRGMLHTTREQEFISDQTPSEEIPELKKRLARLRDVSKELAHYLGLPNDSVEKKGGAPKKIDRAKFLQQTLSVYYRQVGNLSAHGDKKKFVNIAEILCKQAGYGIGSLEKLMREVMKTIPSRLRIK